MKGRTMKAAIGTRKSLLLLIDELPSARESYDVYFSRDMMYKAKYSDVYSLFK